ncbi:MAG: HTTM domain-containing protein [Solirubrobacterales bacterium]|nr:HTTM domain-containing protein [Solirubrobacterales bacterium]
MRPRASDRTLVDADARWLFGLFAALLASSLILHQLWWDGFEVFSVHFVVILAALSVVLRPTSVVRLLIMLAAEVLAVAVDMPGVGSHTLLVAVLGAAILAYAGATSLRNGRLPGPGALFAHSAPFLAVSLLAVYVAAAVAKMNSGFFDPAFSCAVGLSARVAWFDPSLLDWSWRVAPAIWGTVAIELALPALLAIRRTRTLGLAVGGAFHAVLALAGNVPFSALALALYVAFLPSDTPARLRAVVADRPGLGVWAGRVARLAGSRAAFPVAVGAWLACAAGFAFEPAAGRELIANGTRLVVVAMVVGAGVLAVLSRRRGSAGVHAPRSLRLGHPAFAAGVGLLVLNSLSPYLGLKTESSFTMFSNLKTEGPYWNHAFIPEAVKVFPYQDQLVRVTDSNDPALEQRTRGGALIVRFELERYLRLRPETTATFVEVGAGEETAREVEVSAAALPATPLLDKVAKFRDVRPPGGC